PNAMYAVTGSMGLRFLRRIGVPWACTHARVFCMPGAQFPRASTSSPPPRLSSPAFRRQWLAATSRTPRNMTDTNDSQRIYARERREKLQKIRELGLDPF